MSKVLIVDDESDILQEVAECLEFEGFDILTANSGAEGLDTLRQNEAIRVVVTDLKMPGMDGAAMLEQARGEGLIGERGTVLVSGHMLDESVDPGLADVMMRKPVEVDELVEVIRRYIP